LGVQAPGAVLATRADGTLQVWSLQERWVLHRTLGSGGVDSPLADRVNALAFSPDGDWLATGGGAPSRGGEIHIWNAADGTLNKQWPQVHSDTVLNLAFSPDGALLASGGTDKFARILDWRTGEVKRTLEGHTHHVTGVSWKADGRTLATSGADQVVKIWDTVNGERKKNIQGFGKEITSVQFVGIGDTAVVSSGDARVRLLKAGGDTVRDYGGASTFQYSAAATPDGQRVAAGGDDSILRVWAVESGDKVAEFGPAAP
jgi:WD40 repeat protein